MVNYWTIICGSIMFGAVRVGPKSQFRNGTIGAQNPGIPCIIKVEHISKSHQDRTSVSEI